MFELFLDKDNNFEANVDVSGAPLKESKARVLVESNSFNVMYPADIDGKGNISLKLDGLGSIFNEGERGNISLEVIAEDTVFVPWSEKFVIKKRKAVVAEVASSNKPLIEEKPRITATIKVKSNLEKGLEALEEAYHKYDITAGNAKQKAKEISKIDAFMMKKFPELTKKSIVENRIQLLG